MNTFVHIHTGSAFRDKCHNLLFNFLNQIRISKEYWKKLYHNTLTQYENTKTDAVTCYFSQISNSTFGKNGYFLKSEFQPPKKIKFENIFVFAPNNIDSVLKKCYGNYMELPPKEKRVNHSPEIFDFGDY